MSVRQFTDLELLAGAKILGSPDATAATDLTTLQQLQAAIRGLNWKAPNARAASTSNIALATGGLLTIDGVALAAGDSVLAKDQTAGAENGIYVVAAGAWTRRNDADTSAEVRSGLAITVSEGTANADKAFHLTTNDPITLGTTALVFAQLGGGGATYTAGDGLALTGSAFRVVAKTAGGLVVDATGVSVDPAVITRKFEQTIGDGVATTFTITHNLGTQRPQVQVIAAATPFDTVGADVSRTSVNALTVTFRTAPAAGAFIVSCQG